MKIGGVLIAYSLLIVSVSVVTVGSTKEPTREMRSPRNLQPYSGYQTMRIFFKSSDSITRFLEFLLPGEAEFYAASYPDVFLTIPTVNGPTEILLPRNTTKRKSIFDYLISHRITYQSSNTDLNSALVFHERKLERIHKYESIAKIIGYFPRFNAIHRWIRAVERAFPEIVAVEQFGQSYEGRQLFSVKIGSAKNRNAPVIFVESGMHGREWLAPAVCIWIIDRAVRSYAYDNQNEPTILNSKYNFMFVIISNPDGYEYSHTTDRLWRKTRSVQNISVCADTGCRTRENITCTGVDGNRNWDAHFGEIGTAGDCKETYPGPKPFSEEEVRSLANYIQSVKSKTRFYLALHAVGHTWAIPPGYVRGHLRNHAAQLKYAKTAVAAIKNAGGPVYSYGTHAELQYMVSGSSSDWAVENDIPFAATVHLSPYMKASDYKPGYNSFMATPEQVETCAKYFQAALRAVSNELHADANQRRRP